LNRSSVSNKIIWRLTKCRSRLINWRKKSKKSIVRLIIKRLKVALTSLK